MNRLVAAFVPFLIGIASVSVSAQTISKDSRLLAECEFIYSYAAQVMQLRNNSGAAISILRRSTIMSTANMMSNAEGDKIPGWKIKIWTDLRPALKAELDSSRVDPITEANGCDRNVMPIALKVRDQRLKLWGQDFDALQQQLMLQMRSSTGI